MGLVLAVEPDSSQADALRQLLRNQVGAEVILVDSTTAAIAEIERGVPDLILLSTLLSPRDEDGLIAHLRSLEGASHLQTLTIPQFRSSREPAEPTKKTSFGGFRKKRPAPAPTGCDPAVFAKEIVDYLAHAKEVRSRPKIVVPRPVAAAPPPPPIPFNRTEPDPVEPPRAESWDQPSYDPFEPLVQLTETEPTAPIERVDHESFSTVFASRDNSAETLTAEVARVQAEAEAKLAAELERVRAEADERRLAEVERLQAEAEAFRQAAIDEARAAAESQARDALVAEMARVRTEAEKTVAEALSRVRTEAEHLARVREETDEQSAAAHRSREAAEAEARALTDELARLRNEAEETLTSELARVRTEVEQTLGHQLDKAKAEADRMREAELTRAQTEAEILRATAAQEARRAAEAAATHALESEVARVRAEAEARLQAELNRVREEAEHARFADQVEARHTAEKMREAATREARTVAQMAANRTLDAEIARVRADAEAVLEAELARARTEAEKRRVAELQEIRAQMAGLQRAAAQQARAAAAEAVASEVARATSESRQTAARSEPKVVRMPPRITPTAPPPAVAKNQAPTPPSHDATPGGGDYYSLWGKEPVPPPAIKENRRAAVTSDVASEGGAADYYSLWRQETPVPEKPPAPKTPRVYRQPLPSRTKWALPLAASLLFVAGIAGNGIAIDTTAWLPGPAEKAQLEASAAVAPQPVPPAAPAKKVGELRVESTPEGARVLIDGRSYGKTPLTVLDLPAGKHTVVLQGDSGTITRSVTIKAGGTTDVSESIFSGWLAVFSRIPLDIHVNGKPMWKTDDGQLMIPPGRYEIELVNQPLNYREKKTLEVKPGEITAYDVSPPMGAVHVEAPDGVAIRIDGEPAGQTPISEIAVPIGVREIVGAHPELGERRETVQVRYGVRTEVTLNFQP